jgi:hypothetical protein
LTTVLPRLTSMTVFINAPFLCGPRSWSEEVQP